MDARGAIGGGVVLLALVLPESAAADDGRARRALLYDIRKLVSAQEDTGWKIDRYEIEDSMADALVSVCPAEVPVRQAALALAEKRVAAEGGPLDEAIARGRDPDDLSELITATRVRDLLREAIARAGEDCPAWIAPDPEFRGVQTDAYRVTLNLEVGGLAIAQRRDGSNEVGAGGSGRLLLGYGIDHHWSVLFGAEFGGAALFKREGDTTQFPLQFTVAAPLVFRHHFLTFHHDLELAPLIFFNEADQRPSYGVRVAGAIGVSTVRIRNIMPWAGLGTAFEHYFANSFRGSVGSIRAGARVGFDWDF